MSACSERTAPTEQVSRNAGRYLVEIYFASTETDGRVRTGTLGARLDVRPASVTEMISTLASENFLDYEKHAGVELTDEGQTVAEELAWRTCVTERFFAEVLDGHVDRTMSYRIGFELPQDGLANLGGMVELPCRRACSHLERSNVRENSAPKA